MATDQTSTTEGKNDLSDIKRKLAWRMAFAGLMIIALLGGLALFDRLSMQSEPEPAAPQFTEPVPVPRKAATQPLTSAEPAPEASAAPLDQSAPLLEPPPRPEVSAQPVLPRATPSAGRPAASTGQPANATAPALQAKPAESRTPPLAAPPARSQPPGAALSLQSPPAPWRLFSGYGLQAGVFADPRRAEELHAKLTLEGIPSTIEARVQVGPFKSRQEAEATREKMKTLGIDAVLLLPKGVKR
jgi:DedD protein